jgi:hypothetical protein
MNYTPLGVAAAVGLADGAMEKGVVSTNGVSYGHLIVELGAVAGGFYAHHSQRLSPNTNYALMTAGTALFFSRLPLAFKTGIGLKAAYSDVQDVSGQGLIQPVTRLGYQAEVAGAGALGAPRLTAPQPRQSVTSQG